MGILSWLKGVGGALKKAAGWAGPMISETTQEAYFGPDFYQPVETGLPGSYMTTVQMQRYDEDTGESWYEYGSIASDEYMYLQDVEDELGAFTGPSAKGQLIDWKPVYGFTETPEEAMPWYF